MVYDCRPWLAKMSQLGGVFVLVPCAPGGSALASSDRRAFVNCINTILFHCAYNRDSGENAVYDTRELRGGGNGPHAWCCIVGALQSRRSVRCEEQLK